MAQKDYFQQEVNYKIAVTLDDQEHTLTGNIEMEYTNNAPETLDFIYLHLWGNAFKDRTTAFARQKIRTNSTRFYFAEDSELGNYSDLSFSVDGQPARLEFEPENPDIARLYLPQPLSTGQSINISSPFVLKIPASFSRLGHVGESYQMTQWYPKPAVYDRDGWHPMPYLDMGEFYSEFGDFDVTITLPENYVVGATGVLQTESEQAFMQQKVAETKAYLDTLQNAETGMAEKNYPPSSENVKTIRFVAEKVHDFAWFADKRFRVVKSQVTLASGQEVDTWVMFTKTNEAYWKDAINYVDRSVHFYSELVGEYPYPQATAVQSALSAGGGMEYPMITVIGYYSNPQGLDEVITHEVGHNWFYGILAFDERDHPWMDEGLNSYYDHRYTERYYSKQTGGILPRFLLGDTEATEYEIGYLLQARRDRDQAPQTTSDEFVPINYWLGGYEKPAVVFKYLEKYLGTVTFDTILQDFYRKWAFKHPQPEDLRSHFAAHTDKNLDWFFDGLINSNDKIDYAISDVKQKGDQLEITVHNRGDIAAPFPISAVADSTIQYTQWQEGFDESQTFSFPAQYGANLAIDAQRWSLDVNRKNNYWHEKGLLKKVEPLSFKFLGSVENDKRTTLYYLPYPAYNTYDGFMLGMVLHNLTLPDRRFEFSLAPAYGFASKKLVGLGSVKYHWFWGDGLKPQQLTLGVAGRSYSFSNDLELGYKRIHPYVEYTFKRNPISRVSHHLKAEYMHLIQDYPIFNPGPPPTIDEANLNFFGLEYTQANSNVLNPGAVKIRLEYFPGNDELFVANGSYLKLSLEGETSLSYARGKRFDIRGFVGFFPQNENRNRGLIATGALNLSAQGYNDYTFDELYFGRFEQEGLWSQQIHQREGGMRYGIGSAYSLGRSNSFAMAFNMESDLPFKLPGKLRIRPYLDFGYFHNAMPTGTGDTFNDQFLWTGGFSWIVAQGIFEINFPVVSSKNLQDIQVERGNYFNRITFLLDLRKAHPKKIVDRTLEGVN